MTQQHPQSISLEEAADTMGQATVRRSFRADLMRVFSDLWQYRELLYQLTWRDIRVRYKQAFMGFGWAVFMPACIVLSGILVKYAMAHVAGRDIETGSITGMVVKALPWAFFVGTINTATSSLTGNMNLVMKIYFPRAILPLSSALAQAFDSLIGSTILLIALMCLSINLSFTLVWAPVLGVLLFFYTAAMALCLSCANLFFRDVRYIVQVLLMFGIFFTPVFFEPAMFGKIGAQIMMLNPIAPLLEGFRLSFVEGHNLLTFLYAHNVAGQDILLWSPWYLLYSVCWAVGGFLGVAVAFHRLQFLFAEYI
ncbi:MAG: ABC transporter permease [Candidatus Tectimicrobiota bacterium]